VKKNVFPVFMVFVAMGFVDAVGPFVSLAKKEFDLNNAVAALIPFVGLSMFGLLSVPAGIFQHRHGKKMVLIGGLAVSLLGVLTASFGLHSFPLLLITVVLIGAGAAILQVAGNPIMRDVSPPGKYARNLSLGQFAKAVGSLSGPLIPAIAARFFNVSWQIVFPVYSVALVLTLVAAGTITLPSRHDSTAAATLGSCLALLKKPAMLAMAGAIFLYVGAEVSVSAGIPLFLKERFGLEISRVGLLGTGLFFLALTVGRFGGGMILNWVRPSRFLVATSVVSLCGLVTLFAPARNIAIMGFLLTGLGFANIFPLVFSTAIDSMPERANEISGLLVTAIAGGAILPLLMGVLADRSSVRTAWVVPLGAILYVFLLALWRLNARPLAEAAC
jgi:fucose permease